MFSVIRTGYMGIPEPLVEPFAKARNVMGQSSSPVIGLGLAQFLSNGSFAKHISKMRHIYRNRKDSLLVALQEYCSDSLRERKN